MLPELQVTTDVLKPYGYDVFQGQIAITEGPVDEEYLVGPRDELLIETWGEYKKRWPVRVSEDGFIDLEDEEQRVFVNGRTLLQVKDDVTRKLSETHATIFNWEKPSESKAWVEVRAMRVRPLLVYVTGEVFKPGTYPIQSTAASLINVLTNAGGILPTGSLRNVRVSRADGTSEVYDLYDFLIRGETRPVKTRLKYGETVFVDIKRKSCAIRGYVKRPGIYEMTDKESLRDLIYYAGGPLPGAYLRRVQIIRRAINESTRALDVDYTALNDAGTTFPLMDGDVVQILQSVEDEYIVTLEGGGVYRQGIYEYRDKMTLADLIEKGEGLRGEAYLAKADLIRTRPDKTKELTSFSLTQLYKWDPATGKMVYSAKRDHPQNFLLQRQDKVIIYSYFDIIGRDKKVTLEGHVKKPGEYVLAEGMLLSALLRVAEAGFDDPDWRKATYLERADLFRTNPNDLSIQVIPVHLGRLLDGDPAANIPLQSLDRLVVYEYKDFYPDAYFTINGAVREPGRYKLATNATLDDAIVLAKGLLDEAYKYEAEIIRTSPASVTLQEPAKIFTQPIREDYATAPRETGFRLMKDDQIFVRTVPGWEKPRTVSVRGQVQFPGEYVLAGADERLSSLVGRRAKLKDTAWLPGAVFTRLLDADSTPPMRVRVAVDLKQALAKPGSAADLILRDGDELHIPMNPMTVEVRGAVHVPATLQYEEGRTVDYYIKRCGGYRRDALRSSTLILNPDGTSTRRGWGWFGPRPLAGSVIVVPPYSGEIELGTVLVRAPDVAGTIPVYLVQVPQPKRAAPPASPPETLPRAGTAPSTGGLVVQYVLAPTTALPTTGTLSPRMMTTGFPPARPGMPAAPLPKQPTMTIP